MTRRLIFSYLTVTMFVLIVLIWLLSNPQATMPIRIGGRPSWRPARR